MTTSLVLTQLLNGIQLGALLFLLSAGLTLVFGIMNFVNLMHGSLFMMGAYFAAAGYKMSGSFAVAALVAFLCSDVAGYINGQVIGAYVVEIGKDVVIAASREHSRIVIRRDRIDAVAGN